MSNPIDLTQISVVEPIKTTRAFEELCNTLKGLILKGVLKPGDKLPSEIKLASQFNVGRQTVREALRCLELSGFINMQKGGTGGPVVVNTVLNAIGNLFFDAFRMGQITVDQLTIARIEIEKMVLNYVLNNPDINDFTFLENNILAARQKLQNNIIPFEQNIGFHTLLAASTKNHVFVIVIGSINTVVADFRSRFGLDFEFSRRVVNEHESILEAIKEGRHDQALALMEMHLLSVATGFKRHTAEEEVKL